MPLPLAVSCYSKSRLGPLNEGVFTQRTPLPTGLYTVYVNWLPDVILYYGPNAGNSRVAISSADVSRCQWRFRTRLRLTDNVALSHKPLGSSAWHLSSRSGEASHKLLYTVYLLTKVSRTVIPTKKKKNVDRGVFIDPFSLHAAAELLIQTTESCSAAGRFVLRSARGRYSSRAVTPSSGTLRCSSYWRETCPPCRAHVSVAPADC